VPEPERVESLDDLAPTIELYHHTVGAGRYDEAWLIYRDRLWYDIFYRLGAYHTQIELLNALLVVLPKLSEESTQAHVLNELAGSYALSGQPRQASSLLQKHNSLRVRTDEKRDASVGLTNLAGLKIDLGELGSAEETLLRSIEIRLEADQEHPWSHSTDDLRTHPEFDQACAHEALGCLFRYLGRRQRAQGELDIAFHLFLTLDMQQSLGSVWAERALLSLAGDDSIGALEAANKSLALADNQSVERDSVRAEWLLGAAYRARGELAQAESHLEEALHRCRRINLIETEPNILLELARLRRAQVRTGALSLAQEALDIADRCQYRLVQADCHNFLAQLALEAGDRQKAQEHAGTARERAWCDGPPHRYEAAFQEAERLLKEIESLKH
jgi:tetratricopeptide (TPR) repeat protein